MTAINISALPPRVRRAVAALRNDRPVYYKPSGKPRAIRTIAACYKVGSDEYGTVERVILSRGWRLIIGRDAPLI